MADLTTDRGKSQATKVFNRIFLILIFTSLLLVFTVISVWILRKQTVVGQTGLGADKLTQPRGADPANPGQCQHLEYRYKHFRTVKRRHIATIYFLNGDRYYGEVWEQKLRINDVSRYVGVEGEKMADGWGEMEYADGTRYTGQWERGVREGCGVIVKKGYLSTRYSGAWTQDKQTGLGEMIYSNGARYQGEWVNNQYHGQGELAWANGDIYTGQFLYGSMHGQGTFTYSDGSRYSGVWSQGQSTGEGKLLTAKGVCLEIQWRGGQPTVYNGDNCKNKKI